MFGVSNEESMQLFFRLSGCVNVFLKYENDIRQSAQVCAWNG